MVINLKNCLCYDCNAFRDEIRFYLSPEKHNFTIKNSNKLFPDTMQIHTTQTEGIKEEIHLKKQRVANKILRSETTQFTGLVRLNGLQANESKFHREDKGRDANHQGELSSHEYSNI
jgi:hypothetical protein